MSLSRRSVMQSAVLGSVAALAGVAGSAQAKIKKPLPAQKVSEKRRVLIQSSSRYHTSGYLDFAGEQYEQLYGSSKHEILFIPYAKVAGTYDGYEKQVQDAFKPFGHKIVSIHRFKDPQKAVREASAIAVGGGNMLQQSLFFSIPTFQSTFDKKQLRNHCSFGQPNNTKPLHRMASS